MAKFYGNHWWCEYCNSPCDDGGILDGKWACISCIDREENRKRLIQKFSKESVYCDTDSIKYIDEKDGENK